MKNITPLREFDYVPGQKISVPGIYRGVPMDVYHGDLCVGPSVSSGVLRTIENRSPLHVWDASYLNPEAAEREDAPHFAIGRARHTLYLGEEGFRQQYCIRPEKQPDNPDKPWNSNETSCKRWLAEAEKARLTVLKPEQMEDIRRGAEVLGAHPAIQAGLLKGSVERSIVWPVSVPTSKGTIVIWVKARPDVLTTDSLMIVDYKTTTDASPISCRRAITDHLYHMQLALIEWGMFATTGRKIEDKVLVFQEVKRPYAVNIKPIGSIAIEYGHRQNWRSLLKFADAVATGVWQSYDDDEVSAGLMPYAADRLAKEAERDELPTFDPYKKIFTDVAALEHGAAQDDAEAPKPEELW